MNLKKVKLAFTLSVTIALISCNNNVPINSNVAVRENFQDLDKEYIFQTEALTKSYFKRKILKWLTEPVNGPALLKELVYAKYKHSALYCDILADDPEIHNLINVVDLVNARKSMDSTFASFIDGCGVSGSINEFQVNTYTTSQQQNSSVAMDNNGDFVIAWMSRGQDGSSYGVYAQRYDSVGTAQGTEFQVNTTTTWFQNFPSVAMDADGDFIITWASFTVSDGNGYEALAQRYFSNGDINGSEFTVNSIAAGNQRKPVIATDNDGDFVIAWGDSPDGSEGGVFARMFNSDAEPQGTEFQVNTTTSYVQADPAIAMDNDGDFVITWNGFIMDSYTYDVFGQRYNSAGEAQGSEFRINIFTEGKQSNPAVAMDDDGDFVVTWSSNGEDSYYFRLYAQRYNSEGVAQGSEFKVNDYTIFDEPYPSSSMDSDGNFIITWHSRENNIDGYYNDVFAKRYNSVGVVQGSEFQVNGYTTHNQGWPSVAMDNEGDFVVTWQSFNQEDPPYYFYGVFAQRYNSAGVAQ
jgi:hypothetical protein